MTDTPVLRQYREAKAQHPNAFLLFRLGDFYELFFEDAVEAAPILGVTLTSRPLGKSGRAPMCGVPQHAWQSYVGKLLRAGRSVVICDQVEAAGKGLVRREVTRVLTPGTVLEDAYLEPSRSNHLVAAWTRGAEAGLAACDVSAGEMLLCQLAAELLPAEIERWHPSEVLTPPQVEQYRFDPEVGRERLRDRLGVAFPGAIGAEAAPLAVGAAGVVLEYLETNRFRLQPGCLRIRTYSPDAAMQLDAATRRNLDLDALVELCSETVTAMGARRLRAWLHAPLRDLEAIELRLDAVAEFEANVEKRRRVAEALRAIADVERLTARCVQQLASARELVSLRRSLESLPHLALAVDGIESLALRRLAAQLTPPPAVVEQLQAALVDDPPTGARGAGSIRPGYDTELDRIREASRDSRAWIAALEARERARTGVRTLRVGFNRVFGYYVEVGHAQAGSVPAEYIRKQTLAGAERYVTAELKDHEATVLNADRDIEQREQQVIRDLQESVAGAAPALLESAEAVAEIDGLQSLASVASTNSWVRPVVDASLTLDVRRGRHPLVERSLPAGEFVANDIHLDAGTEQLSIVTGPNMAGKSTFLRQAALIVLLAQCGGFVPAEAARIGMADRIFTRVGAHDDLAAGASTFMVEMTETANILHHATRSSFLILDEVGRGTSTYDGVSIAEAVVEHIHDRIGARTLFATHYHELTALAERLERVCNHRVEVVEEHGQVRFMHSVVPGGADRSYGIHVAALAGLPQQVIQRARQVLAELEAKRPIEPPEQQLFLPLQPVDALRGELVEIDIDSLTPLEALQKLHELRQRAATL